jgi:hypothetical protein
MMKRWQERRVENELLKRELLLRLRAEHSAVPGRGEPATDYFRRRVRWLLLRHPLFALKLYLLLLDVGLGRTEARKRSQLGDPASAPRLLGGASVVETNPPVRHVVTPTPSASRRRLGLANKNRQPARVRLGAGIRRQRLGWQPRVARGLHRCESASAAGAAVLSRQKLWFTRLVHALRLSRLFAVALAAALRRAGGLFFAGVVSAVQSARAVAASLVAEGRRRWPALRLGVVRAVRKAELIFRDLAAAGSRQRTLMQAHVARLQRSGKSKGALLLSGLRRQWLVAHEHLVHALQALESLAARWLTEARHQWSALRLGLVRATRQCVSALESLAAGARRQSESTWERLLQIQRALWRSTARLATALRSRRHVPRAHLVRVQRKSRSVTSGLGAEGLRLGATLGAAAVGVTRKSGSTLKSVVTATRRRGSLMSAHLAQILRAFELWRRRRWALARTAAVGVAQGCGAALISLMTAARRQRALMYARLLQMRRAFAPRRPRIPAELHRQRLGSRGQLFRAQQTVSSGLAGLSAAFGRRRRSWQARVFALERASRSVADRLVTSRPKLSLREGRARHVSQARQYVAGVRVVPRLKTGASSRDFQRSRAGSTTRPTPARFGLPRAAGVVVAGFAVVAIAGTAIVAMRGVGSNRETSAGSGLPRSTDQIGRGFLHFPATPPPADNAHASPGAPRRAERTTARTARRTKPSVAKHLTLVSNTVQSAATPAAPTTSTAAPPSSAGPSPLPAPPGASSPSPLKAPGR